MQKYNNRNEVPEEFKWDLTPFFKNDDEWEESYKKTSKLINRGHTLFEFENMVKKYAAPRAFGRMIHPHD